MQRKVVKVTDNPEQGVRLERLISTLNITQTSLAQTLGISQSYVSQMVGGTRNISRRVLHFITNNYPDVNVRWLMTGEGEMFFEKKEGVEAGVLTGVMEPDGVYETALRKIALEDLAGIIASMQAEIRELRERVRALEEGKKE